MKAKKEIVLSTLGHTWILDLDGTIVKHNGYIIDGKDSFLPNAEKFLSEIPKEDMIIFLTSRTEKEKELTETFLRENHVRYHAVIYGAPYGERILMNDEKPSGLVTAVSISGKRNICEEWKITFSENL